MKWECYIEEYMDSNGLNARLREKNTNKKIVILIKSQKEKMQLLKFLSEAKRNIDIIPTIFDRDGKDIVAVYGINKKEDETTIEIDVSNGGEYKIE